MTLELTPEQIASIQAFVRTGAYRNEVDVIDQALKSLLERDQLRRKIQEGIDDLENGRYKEYGENDLDQFMADIEATSERLLRERKQQAS
jgi:Arc/MetJ-type ribon-helix-helix transcriptional regulator